MHNNDVHGIKEAWGYVVLLAARNKVFHNVLPPAFVSSVRNRVVVHCRVPQCKASHVVCYENNVLCTERHCSLNPLVSVDVVPGGGGGRNVQEGNKDKRGLGGGDVRLDVSCTICEDAPCLFVCTFDGEFTHVFSLRVPLLNRLACWNISTRLARMTSSQGLQSVNIQV